VSPTDEVSKKAFINTGLLRSHQGACLSFLVKNSGRNIGVLQINRILLNNNNINRIYQEILIKNSKLFQHW
jgi:hypothetical protein